MQEFQKAGLLDEKHTINHGYGLVDESWKLIRDAGMAVNACPRSDSQWALGDAHMGLQGALNEGIRPGLSVDNDTAYSTDLFSEMQVAFHLQRWTAHMARAQNEPNPRAAVGARHAGVLDDPRRPECDAAPRPEPPARQGGDLVVIRVEDIKHAVDERGGDRGAVRP